MKPANVENHRSAQGETEQQTDPSHLSMNKANLMFC